MSATVTPIRGKPEASLEPIIVLAAADMNRVNQVILDRRVFLAGLRAWL